MEYVVGIKKEYPKKFTINTLMNVGNISQRNTSGVVSMPLKCILCGKKFFVDTPLDIIDKYNHNCPYKRKDLGWYNLELENDRLGRICQGLQKI